MSEITTGAGMVIDLGTEDISGTVTAYAPQSQPQHLPLFFIFAQRGEGRHRVSGAERQRRFGSATFEEESKYFNHATLFANEANSVGNSAVIERLIPEDAGPKANAIIWIDVLETENDTYRRGSDGRIVLDAFGKPEVTGSTKGVKVFFHKTYRDTREKQAMFGDAAEMEGSQVDPDDATKKSKSIPLFEYQESSYGSDGLNTGFRMWAPTAIGGNVMPTTLMQDQRVYPYYFSLLERTSNDTGITSPKVSKTIMGETQVLFSFKEDTRNPTTRAKIGFSKILGHYNASDDQVGNVVGRINKVYVYTKNLETLLAKFHELEVPHITERSDFTADPADKHLFNFLGGVDSSNAEYESYVFVDVPKSIRFSQFNNVFLDGGSDGTMNDEVYNAMVRAQLERYGDPDDVIQDQVSHPECWFYDTGLKVEQKYAMGYVISQRKDTLIVAGTHIHGEPAMTESEEHSLAVALRTYYNMFPESVNFGTGVMRAMIMGRSGLPVNSLYEHRVPATFEVLNKFAQYMGASDGKWKDGKSPEGFPGHVVNRLKDINITWVSKSARNRNWSAGLNWILKYDEFRCMIPHYKTVYADDTSVLNSMLTAAAIAELNKVAHSVWRDLVGRTDLTAQQLASRSNELVIERTFGRFNNRYQIIPRATITDADAQRGFSWTLPIVLGANNMRNTMTTYVQAARASSLNQTQEGA